MKKWKKITLVTQVKTRKECAGRAGKTAVEVWEMVLLPISLYHIPWVIGSPSEPSFILPFFFARKVSKIDIARFYLILPDYAGVILYIDRIQIVTTLHTIWVFGSSRQQPCMKLLVLKFVSRKADKRSRWGAICLDFNDEMETY
jgi:hypothetical protein